MPTSTTTPETSIPSLAGSESRTAPRCAPARILQSMGFTDDACTSTSTSSGPHAGSGTSSTTSTSGPP